MCFAKSQHPGVHDSRHANMDRNLNAHVLGESTPGNSLAAYGVENLDPLPLWVILNTKESRKAAVPLWQTVCLATDTECSFHGRFLSIASIYTLSESILFGTLRQKVSWQLTVTSQLPSSTSCASLETRHFHCQVNSCTKT